MTNSKDASFSTQSPNASSNLKIRRSHILLTNFVLTKIEECCEYGENEKTKILNMLCLNDIQYKKSYFKRTIVDTCVKYAKTSRSKYLQNNGTVAELLTIKPNDNEKKVKNKRKLKVLRIKIKKTKKLKKCKKNKLKLKTLIEYKISKTKLAPIFPLDSHYIEGMVNVFQVRERTLVTYRDALLSLLNHQPSDIIEDVDAKLYLKLFNKDMTPEQEVHESPLENNNSVTKLTFLNVFETWLDKNSDIDFVQTKNDSFFNCFKQWLTNTSVNPVQKPDVDVVVNFVDCDKLDSNDENYDINDECN